jgi:hypothetical protein
MLTTTMVKTVLCLLIVLSGASATLSPDDQTFIGDDTGEEVLIWASNGGGWRSMAICMGFANIFAQAGLFTNTSSRFASISTNSGASWFNTQFFYSQEYFDRTLTKDPQELYDFVVEWMHSYRKLWGHAQLRDCSFLDVAVHEGLSVPHVFDCMLEQASTDYGDPGLTKRPASHDNRVPALSSTHMYIQIALIPTARATRRPGLLSRYSLTYLGPSNMGEKVYAVNIPYQYAVKQNYTLWYAAVESGTLPIKTYNTDAPRGFRFRDWEIFHLYPPGDDASIFTTKMPRFKTSGIQNEPFGGNPKVNQVAISSTAVAAFLSGNAPSFFAQRFSIELNAIMTSSDSLLRKLMQRIWLLKRTNLLYAAEDRISELAMCSQWPDKCGPNDAMLGDGGFSDGSGLAQHIGQHHTIDKGDKTKTLKVIKTFTYFLTDKDPKFLSYFNTTFNQGVEPGDFIWIFGTVEDQVVEPNPYRSMQIFEEYLDQETLSAIRIPIPGVNVSTARMVATTIDNPAAGVQAGQKVDMLLLFFYGSVPTQLFGTALIDKWKDLLGETARSIAASTELLGTIQDFLS